MDNVEKKILKECGPEALEYYKKNFDPDELIKFDGMVDCYYNECVGWDGESRRCCCGNRRVDWIWERGHLFAEAY